MQNQKIFTRYEFIRKGMLSKVEEGADNYSLIEKFKKLIKIYDGFLSDIINVGMSSISINNENKFSVVAKEVKELKKSYSLSAVVATTKNNAIGISHTNKLPWTNQKADMARFVKLTTGNVVVLGRKTFESFGSRPLKNRFHVIITNDKNFSVDEQYADQCKVVHSIQQSLDFLEEKSQSFVAEGKLMEAYVIGGGQIYQQFMKYVDYIFMTKIMVISIDGDVMFPEINMNDFTWTDHESFQADENNTCAYHFRLYERNKQRSIKKEISPNVVKQLLLNYYIAKL